MAAQVYEEDFNQLSQKYEVEVKARRDLQQQFDDTVRSKDKQIDQLKIQSGQLEKEHASLKASFEAQEKTLENTRKELNASNEFSSTSKIRETDLSNKLQTETRLVEQLKNSNRQLEKEAAESKLKAETESKARAGVEAEFRNTKTTLEKQVADLKKTVSELNKAKDSLSAANKKLEASNNEFKSKNAELDALKLKLQSQIRDLNRELDGYQRQKMQPRTNSPAKTRSISPIKAAALAKPTSTGAVSTSIPVRPPTAKKSAAAPRPPTAKATSKPTAGGAKKAVAGSTPKKAAAASKVATPTKTPREEPVEAPAPVVAEPEPVVDEPAPEPSEPSESAAETPEVATPEPEASELTSSEAQEQSEAEPAGENPPDQEEKTDL